MAEVIFVCPSKGGAGATTCACFIGRALSAAGERTLIADGDSQCADATAVCGMGGLYVYTLADAQAGACRVRQAIIKHPASPNLFLLPTLGCGDGDFTAQAVRESAATFDYVLCDCCAAAACGKAVIVTEPYPSSVKAADKKIALLKDGGIKDVGIIVNKVNGGLVCGGEIAEPRGIASILRCPLWGVIPEDLNLPLGTTGGRTAKAFAMTAEVIRGKSEKIFSAAKAYRGLGGNIKRRLRKLV